MSQVNHRIPKLIHYCWFGKRPLDALSIACMQTWTEVLPEYSVKVWNETSFDIAAAPPFVQEAYNKKKFAFVSDYVRAWALHNEGGIYLDTDVSIRKSLDVFLQHSAFTGFEQKGFPFTALWATEKGHIWPKLVLNYYENAIFSEIINTGIVSDLLVGKFGADAQKDAVQELDAGIFIYPSSYFCADLPPNYACHHFNGSWVTETDGRKKKYKDEILYRHYVHGALAMGGAAQVAKQISWPILLAEIPKRIVRPLARLLKQKKA